MQITTKNIELPATIDELNQFIIIGKERLNAQKAKIRAIEKAGIAIIAKEAALSDAQDMADILLDAEVRLGEILEAIPLAEKRASSARELVSLPDGVSKKQSHQAQTLSKNREIVEQAKAEARETGEIPTASHVYKLIKTPHVSYNSGENEWYTPPDYIEAARRVMGDIDLDPASSDIANVIVKAHQHYTKENDGLSKEWHGRIWMNPPYAPELIKLFVSKYYKSIEDGTVTEGIVLVNNATETQWFYQLVECSSAVVFTKGRVRFLDPEGNPRGAPLQGQAILYYGENMTKFLGEFIVFGWGARL